MVNRDKRGILCGMIATAGRRYLAVCLLSFVLASCESVPASFLGRGGGNGAAGGQSRNTDAAVIDAESVQGRIVASALYAVDSQSVVVGPRRFNYDCSGTILSIYFRAGVDLQPMFAEGRGNGVARLHQIGERYQLLYDTTIPQPGDLVFWDNTYDRNRDGKFNDPLTHAGVVISSSPDGTVEYVHHNYSRGIIVERMNLLQPGVFQNGTGAVVNSPMRMSRDRHIAPDLWLSGQLYRIFGMHHRLAPEA